MTLLGCDRLEALTCCAFGVRLFGCSTRNVNQRLHEEISKQPGGRRPIGATVGGLGRDPEVPPAFISSLNKQLRREDVGLCVRRGERDFSTVVFFMRLIGLQCQAV